MALSVAIPLSGLKLEHFDNLTSFLTIQNSTTADLKGVSKQKKHDLECSAKNFFSLGRNHQDTNNNDIQFSPKTSESSEPGVLITKTSKNRRRRQRRAKKNKTDSGNTKISLNSDGTEVETIPLLSPMNFFEAHRFYRQLLTPEVNEEMQVQGLPPVTHENIRRLRRFLGGMVTKNCKQPRVMYNQRNILNLEANLRSFNWQVTWKVDKNSNSAGVKSQLDKEANRNFVSTCCSQCDFNEPYHSNSHKKK